MPVNLELNKNGDNKNNEIEQCLVGDKRRGHGYLSTYRLQRYTVCSVLAVL